jgi:hypothetical protein
MSVYFSARKIMKNAVLVIIIFGRRTILYICLDIEAGRVCGMAWYILVGISVLKIFRRRGSQGKGE